MTRPLHVVISPALLFFVERNFGKLSMMMHRKFPAMMTRFALMSAVLSSASGHALPAFVAFPGVVGATRPARKSGVQCMSGGGDGGKTALCILAPGFEEMEAVSPIDLLRRAGVEVTTAALTTDLTVKGRNGISGGPPAVPSNGLLKGDERVLSLLNKQMDVASLLPSDAFSAGRVVSAICAAPSVLAEAGVLAGKKYTAHFSVEEFVPDMDKTSGQSTTPRSICAFLSEVLKLRHDGPSCGHRRQSHHLTGRMPSFAFSISLVMPGTDVAYQGAGTGTEFGLALIEQLVDKKTADDVAASICWKR
eukprot:1957950-Rhodomonas_salina.1